MTIETGPVTAEELRRKPNDASATSWLGES